MPSRLLSTTTSDCWTFLRDAMRRLSPQSKSFKLFCLYYFTIYAFEALFVVFIKHKIIMIISIISKVLINTRYRHAASSLLSRRCHFFVHITLSLSSSTSSTPSSFISSFFIPIYLFHSFYYICHFLRTCNKFLWKINKMTQHDKTRHEEFTLLYSFSKALSSFACLSLD